jgi:hypothetical protein
LPRVIDRIALFGRCAVRSLNDLGLESNEFSKQVVEGDGLSTSTIPKAQLQERQQTEQRGLSLEVL